MKNWSILREMLQDPEEPLRTPEEVDALVEAEKAENGEEDSDDPIHYIEPGSEEEAEAYAQTETMMRELVGIAVACGVLCLLIGGVLLWNWKYCAGVAIGTTTAIWALFHLYRSVDIALTMQEADARRYSQKMTARRYLVFFLVAAAVAWFGGRHAAIGVFLGFLTLKLAVYLWPLVHKGLTNIRKKRR